MKFCRFLCFVLIVIIQQAYPSKAQIPSDPPCNATKLIPTNSNRFPLNIGLSLDPPRGLQCGQQIQCEVYEDNSGPLLSNYNIVSTRSPSGCSWSINQVTCQSLTSPMRDNYKFCYANPLTTASPLRIFCRSHSCSEITVNFVQNTNRNINGSVHLVSHPVIIHCNENVRCH